uniref:Coiled-coil domain-containing protein 97 n=1 Tax=Ceratitis capitata TaxID=7213 RepID=W8CBQ5_CERCA
MTAEIVEPPDAGIKGKVDTAGAQESTARMGNHLFVPPQMEEIINFLSLNKHIVFKSQQIDDPELLHEEKVQIAREIYSKNAQTFLMRFGSFMEERHLATFSEMAVTNKENNEEMELLLQDYRNKLRTRERDVKNRRYAAMQQLISDGEYFSEQEMMKRAPEMYQELIGQYLSEAEKKQRDEYDVKNTTFSGILMHTMEQQQLQDVLKLADKENVKSTQLARAIEGGRYNGEDEITQSTISSEYDTMGEEEYEAVEEVVPAGFRQQWGNFDNEQVACSSSNREKKQRKEKRKQNNLVRNVKNQNVDNFITAGERELLRQEFIGIMHEQFLSGADKDFDYTQVDDNTQLDDLSQINQDKEDAYFEESDYTDDDEDIIRRETRENVCDEESEDELDVFMNHLNRHHSLQQ